MRILPMIAGGSSWARGASGLLVVALTGGCPEGVEEVVVVHRSLGVCHFSGS
jgi:hypothetical protein